MAEDNRSENQSKEFNTGRRKAIKVGAVAGVASVLAASGLGSIRSGQAYSGLSIPSGRNLDDLMTSSVQLGIVEPFNTVTFFYVPPNSTVMINQDVATGKVAIIREDRMTVSHDHALQISISIDGKEVLFDPDMVQARYATPLSFLDSTSFHPITQSFSVILKNKTSKSRYFSSMQSGGKLSVAEWNSIVKPYLVNVAREVR